MTSLSFDDWLNEDLGEPVTEHAHGNILRSPPTPRFLPRDDEHDDVPALDDLLSAQLPEAEELDAEQETALADREELASELLTYDAEGSKLDGLKDVIVETLAKAGLVKGGAAKSLNSDAKRGLKRASSDSTEEGVKKAAKKVKNEGEEGMACTYICKFPGCAKGYASTDAVRKHCRQRHLEWLRALGHGSPELYCECFRTPTTE